MLDPVRTQHTSLPATSRWSYAMEAMPTAPLPSTCGDGKTKGWQRGWRCSKRDGDTAKAMTMMGLEMVMGIEMVMGA